MAEPARKLDEDFEPGDGPAWKLEIIQGGGESTPERANLSAAPQPASDERAALGLDTPAGDKAAETERQSVTDEPDYMRDSDPAEKGSRRGGFIRRHKKSVAGGGIAGLLLGGGFGLFIFFSGPLEFVHLAQLMQQFHFSDNEDVNDSQLTRLYRWMRWKDKPGNRRLSEMGNKMADKLQVRFEEAGWKFDLDERGYLRGFDIDVETARAHNVDVEGLAAEVGGEITNGHLRIDIDPGNPLKFYSNKKVVRESRRAIGQTGVVASLEGNKIGERGGFTRHPIKAIDSAIREKGVDFIKAQWRKVRGETLSASSAPVHLSGTDDDENPNTKNEGELLADDINSQVETAEPDELGHKAGALKKSLFTVAALTTAYCMARDLAAGASEEEWQQIGMGSERVASYYQGLGGETQAGEGGVDLQQLGFEKELLYDKSDDGDPATQPSSWSDNDFIQKLSGNPGGVPLSGAYRLHSGQNILSEIVAAIPGASILNPACDAANSWLGQTIQLGIGFVTGPFSTVAGEGLQRAFGDDVVNFITRMLAGEGLPTDLAGANLGGVIDQGSFLLSSQELLARGAKPLSPAEGFEIRSYLADLDRQDFESKPLLSRLFDVKDHRSLAAKTYHGAPHSIGSVVAGIFGLPQNVMKSLARLVSLPAYAVDESDIDYGVSQFSFPLNERGGLDESHDNPYENVKVLLASSDSSTGNKNYLTYFNDEGFDKDCFGLELAADDSFEVVGVPRLDQYPDKCKRTDDMWLRYRLHISNVMTATQASCYEDDEVSCQELGYDGGANPASSAAGASIVGDPYTDTTSVACAPGTNDVGVQEGYVEGRLFPVRLCSLPNLPSTGATDGPGTIYSVPGADGHALVNSRVSGAWLALVNDAQTAGISLSATSSFRPNSLQQFLWEFYQHDTSRVGQPGYSSHQAGVAIDFSNMSGFIQGATCANRATSPASPGWVWLRDNAQRYGFRQYAAEPWHWDALPDATSRCGTP